MEITYGSRTVTTIEIGGHIARAKRSIREQALAHG